MYAINANIIKKHLQDVKPIAIATGNFAAIMIPAIVILLGTNFFFESNYRKPEVVKSLGYVILLCTFGTALAKVMFNKLVQISTPVFASSVTYVMTLVALLWGLLDGEKISFVQVIGGVVILFGVYLANRKN
jgi:drug/metabolite transporter (DMT)-like permease